MQYPIIPITKIAPTTIRSQSHHFDELLVLLSLYPSIYGDAEDELKSFAAVIEIFYVLILSPPKICNLALSFTEYPVAPFDSPVNNAGAVSVPVEMRKNLLSSPLKLSPPIIVINVGPTGSSVKNYFVSGL